MDHLQGKTAIITGASAGIGAAIGKELARNGASIVLTARRTEKLNAIKQDILAEVDKATVMTIETDVSNKQDVQQLVEKVLANFGQIDILVNNAGQMKSAAIRQGKIDGWEEMIDVNVKGTLYGIHAVLPSMLDKSSGHIINIASVSGFEVTKTSTVYSATKYAVRAISTGLEKELARTGVKVTNISPGMVDTDLSSSIPSPDRKKLDAVNIANGVIYALTQPDHVNVNEVTIRPV